MEHDTTVKKVESTASPVGKMGQKYLAAGVKMSMRLWERLEKGRTKELRTRPYETLGYVISGRAELETEGQRIVLEPGDCWVVPQGARHRYHVLETFTAVEATSPPAEVSDDAPVQRS